MEEKLIITTNDYKIEFTNFSVGMGVSAIRAIQDCIIELLEEGND